MVGPQLGRDRTDDVRRDVVRAVRPVFERRIAVVLPRNVHAGVVGVEVLHAVARPAGALVGHVGRDLEDVGDEFEVERRGIGHFELVVLLPRGALGEGRITGLGRGLRPGTVGVLQQGERESEHVDLARDHLLAVVHHGLVVLAAHQAGVVVQRQPRADADRTLGAEVILLVGLLAHLVDAVLVVVTARNVVTDPFAAALDADGVGGRIVHRLVDLLEPVGLAVVVVVAVGVDVVVVHRRIGTAALEFLEPGVRIGHVVIEERRYGRRRRGVEIRLAEGIDPLHGVGDHVVLPDHRTAVQRHGAVVTHAHLALLGILGRDENHAECAAGAVYCGRRSVLEHRDRGDVVGVHRTHVAFGTVDEHQRAAALSEFVGLFTAAHTGLERVVHAADGDFAGMVGLTVDLHDVQAGDLALQRTGDVGIGPVFDRVARKVLDRAHDIAFLERAVAYDDYFVHHQLVLLHRDVDLRAAPYHLLMGAVADIREEQRGVPVGRDRIAAVDTRRDADQRPLDSDRHADHRVARSVADDPFHLRFGGGTGCRNGARAARQHDHFVNHPVVDAARREYGGKDGLDGGTLLRDLQVLHRIAGQCRFVGEGDAHLLRNSIGNGLERRPRVG